MSIDASELFQQGLDEESKKLLPQRTKEIRDGQLLFLNSEEGARAKEKATRVISVEDGTNGIAKSAAEHIAELKVMQECNRATIAKNKLLSEKRHEMIFEALRSDKQDLQAHIDINKAEIEKMATSLDAVVIEGKKTKSRMETLEGSSDKNQDNLESFMKQQHGIQSLTLQEKQINQAARRMSDGDYEASFCSFAIHGLPLSKDINELKDSPGEIVSSLKFGLGEDIVKDLLNKNEAGFTNIRSWGPIEKDINNKGYFYSKATPTHAHNGLFFSFKSRAEASKFETRIRRRLIESREDRRTGEFRALELEIYAHGTVKALHKACLYKGKLICEFFPEFSNYRLAWRNGWFKGGSSQSLPYLSVEVKASQQLIDERRDHFFEGSSQSRQFWTAIEDPNILAFKHKIWFPRVFIRREESDRQPSLATTTAETPVSKEIPKRPRSSPGFAGPESKKSSSKSDEAKTCSREDCSFSTTSTDRMNEHIVKQHSDDIVTVDEALKDSNVDGFVPAKKSRNRGGGGRGARTDNGQKKLSEVGFIEKTRTSNISRVPMPSFGNLS